MKKIIFSLCLLFGTYALHAQHLRAGLKAGINISQFTGDNSNAINKNPLVGFHAGGFLNVGGKILSFQPELLVSTAGAKLESGNVTQEIKLTYVAVPLMLQVRPVEAFYLEAGPQFAFKISEDIPSSTIEDFAKDVDISLGVGLGFQTKFGLGIGGRYLIGLSKVGDFDSNTSFNGLNYKNGIIQLGVFYTFGSVKK